MIKNVEGMETTIFPWGHEKRYNDYSSYQKKKFTERVQKVSIDAGFTCPNRDGTKGVGGCIYCNNNSFNPHYCKPQKTVTQQIDEGIEIFASKYKSQKYLAYFQAYSNTYGEMQEIKTLYHEALQHPQVIGLVIGTRPDCVNADLLDHIAELSRKYHVIVEYGLESTIDSSLEFINRCHTHEESVNAIRMTAERGIPVGAHMIMGLPGESREMILSHADRLSELPLNFLKMHQLQIVRHTKLARMYKENPEIVSLFEANEYIDFMVEFLERLNPRIIVERFASQSPHSLLIAPLWGLKNFEIVARVEKRLAELDSYQGKKYQ